MKQNDAAKGEVMLSDKSSDIFYENQFKYGNLGFNSVI